MAKDIDVLLEQQADQMTAVLKSHASHIEACWRSIAFRSRSWRCTTARNRSFVRYSTTCVIAWYKSPSMKLALLMLRMRGTCCEYLIAWNCQH
ncbi:hypothetical protein [Klebsiella aerogenes]|uniref:hypothetical protein n=1 Tax=Klebsiella aerogenes TaxID=548 RepID=UPI000FC99579|nr:hypothetical protein [Klebsiella aerogenes]